MTLEFKTIFVSILLLFSTASQAHWDAAYFRNATDGFTDKSEWMQGIPNGTKLSELALPGTHDSATYNIRSEIATTQALSIAEQLRYGIRVFDIRVRHTGNKFALHHGPMFLHLMFGDVLEAMDNFLAKHPSETVFLG